ncbi:MAG: Gfo/Idh/MocA family oxidoreductase [Verrucomicrobia bacterium]|jgi:predicted dehydrogenase|nr:Gfo/Idh/MocA family oxidoreductase [Verrucomicrobiota bacterium]OQC63556.1 MAG: Inositol 2-dehydrogenase [Verrucomicrobia bacterium ADurb.Bin006]MDI9381018.1 Gfo/Idh/MocA family oxidoreductase [Verrucomicrobiota bacterium]NMD19108.1 Gfo/Idh/MocA family oxidoreductase [Verrucomicrobiota bacterium]HNU99613.1 Gfo/Idh/MocA family oxidoreductase [Verrucomicrobiota bacterium]
MNTPLTRRGFLRANLTFTFAAATLPHLVPASVLGQGQPSPNSRIQVGCIGVGPQGRGVMSNFLSQPDCRVIALCDVAKRNLDAALQMVSGHYKDQACAKHHDYRELLRRSDIDAVLIATPDHWHVPIAVAAARANKDMYVEKPLGLSVEEDQRLRAVCGLTKRIFQFGTQQRSGSQFRLACELVLNGRIGSLKEISVWASASRPGGSTRPVPPPADLDYPQWLGPARAMPYTDGKAFDGDPADTWKTWWFNYDYALGFIAGWGVHPLDIAYWGHPAMMRGKVGVEGKGVIPTEGACNTSVAWDVRFKFADGVRMIYRGTRNNYEPVTPMNDLRPWEQKFGRAIDHGTAFEGTDGWVLVDRGAIRTSPEDLVETTFGPNDRRLVQSSNHVRNFLDSIKSRQPAVSPIEDSVQADILCHLSDIATRVDRPLNWDPAKEQFVDDNDANARLKMRPVRQGWEWA